MAKAGYGDLEVGAETSSVQAVHPAGTAAAPGLTFSADADTGIYRVGANEVGVSAAGVGQISIVDGVLQPVTTNDIDLGTASLQFKNAWFDGTLEADAITVGGVSVATGTNATTVTTTANNADETVYPTFVDGTSSSQDIEVDTGLTYNPSTGLLTISGELDAGSLDISGNADIDGTLEADAITVDGSSLASVIAGTTVTTATNATNITVADTTDSTCFVGLWESVTGAQPPKSDTGLTYDASTGTLTATAVSSASVKSAGFIIAMS